TVVHLPALADLIGGHIVNPIRSVSPPNITRCARRQTGRLLLRAGVVARPFVLLSKGRGPVWAGCGGLLPRASVKYVRRQAGRAPRGSAGSRVGRGGGRSRHGRQANPPRSPGWAKPVEVVWPAPLHAAY